MPEKPSEILAPTIYTYWTPTIYTYWTSNEGLVCPLCSSKLRHEFDNVVTLGRVPKYKHQYVEQLSVKGLNAYILRRPKKLSFNEINQIEKWFYSK